MASLLNSGCILILRSRMRGTSSLLLNSIYTLGFTHRDKITLIYKVFHILQECTCLHTDTHPTHLEYFQMHARTRACSNTPSLSLWRIVSNNLYTLHTKGERSLRWVLLLCSGNCQETRQVVPTAVHRIQIPFLLIMTEGIHYRTALYWTIMYLSSLHSSITN